MAKTKFPKHPFTDYILSLFTLNNPAWDAIKVANVLTPDGKHLPSHKVVAEDVLDSARLHGLLVIDEFGWYQRVPEKSKVRQMFEEAKKAMSDEAKDGK